MNWQSTAARRTLFLLTGLLLLWTARADQPAAASSKEPVCGFTLNSHYLDSASVTSGPVVQMATVGSAQLSQPTVLRFLIYQKPDNAAIDNLQLEHEKYIHVVGVRDDLSVFFHIHPVKIAPGVWQVTNNFTEAGNYKIWADVHYHDSSYAFAQPLLAIPGSLPASAPPISPTNYALASGYQVTLKHTEPLLAGNAASLQFLIRDSHGREIVTENFLGAPMHLVIVKDDLSVYRHAHPEHQENPDPLVSFNQFFPDPGNYKLFAQFRPLGTSLPAEEAILATFLIRVLPNSSNNSPAK